MLIFIVMNFDMKLGMFFSIVRSVILLLFVIRCWVLFSLFVINVLWLSVIGMRICLYIVGEFFFEKFWLKIIV